MAERPRYGNGYGIINLATGQVVDEPDDGEHYIVAQDGDTVISLKQKQYNKRKRQIITKFGKGSRFNKVWVDAMKKADEVFLRRDMTKAYAMMASLQKYIDYDGSIRIDGKFATITDLANEYNVTRAVMSKVINQLIENEVLAKCETGEYLTDGTRRKKCLLYNPYISVKSKDVPVFLVDFFRDTQWNTWGDIDHENEDE